MAGFRGALTKNLYGGQVDQVKELQKRRPIFYSEADFQYALAWEIHRQHPPAAVRLEINQGALGKREYSDILVNNDATICAVELKYKTRKLDIIQNREEFHLLNQRAQNIGGYVTFRCGGRDCTVVGRRL